MDLFDSHSNPAKPLADELRPSDLGEFVGQTHLIGPGRFLSECLKQEKIPSLLFWGPPGSGKTTLAHIISRATKHHFVTLSAVMSNIKEVKEVIEKARQNLTFSSRQTILFIDEIHRFNKAQQDAFLPHVEHGVITLIGATTENPSFEVIPALLSRCQVVVLKPLTAAELKIIAQRALAKKGRAGGPLAGALLGSKPLGHWLTDEAVDFLVENAHGDARYLLNILEDVLTLFVGKKTVGLDELQNTVLRRSLIYDKKSEHHYNVISAFIKSMRDSDPDAALYYLARMLESGENPLFIARRMVIFASEDIGNANPVAVQVAVACMQAFDFVGEVEGWIPLAHCAAYLASSPKSNATYAGYQAALADVRVCGALEVPLHLRNAPTKLMKDLGYHQGYQYAHDHEVAKVNQQHLPDALKERRYYFPTDNGFEKKLKEWLHRK